jgi:fibronectin type 3 domain-containing protein
LEFKDRIVSLRWDRTPTFPYSAYIVERSEDGTTFRNILESPITTLSPDQILSNEYEYASDSIPATDRVYYYRIKGLTPFGELGPASQIVSGRSIPVVEQVPYITAAVSEDNQTIEVRWEFPEHNNQAIQGFTIDRASSPSAPPSELTVGLLPPGVRSFHDSLPGQSNYYRVRALGHDDQWYSSHVYFSQLIDSIPPSVPTQLKAIADDGGIISISWAPNKDKDIFGYRIYKANNQNEEVVQLTVEPTNLPEFRDTMDLNVLNESVYYSVMAIDNAQNHSRLSELLEVELPDKVRPQPPVLLPVSGTAEGIVLTWLPTPSQDVVAYQVFRKHTDDRWILLNTMQAGPDSLFTFTDQTSGDGRPSQYTVIAVDDAGLESDPSLPVQGVHKSGAPKSSIQWRKARLSTDENEITLSWIYTLSNVDIFTIFRSENSNPFLLHKIIPADSRSYKEPIIPGRSYKYRIMVSFKDGSKSSLSDELVFQY